MVSQKKSNRDSIGQKQGNALASSDLEYTMKIISLQFGKFGQKGDACESHNAYDTMID
jgi:hypothetical protein